jgi:hypothetical protein
MPSPCISCRWEATRGDGVPVRWRRSPVAELPQGANWHRAQFRPERQGCGAGVEDDAEEEVVAESVREPSQPGEVLCPYRLCGFDLDGYDVAASVSRTASTSNRSRSR